MSRHICIIHFSKNIEVERFVSCMSEASKVIRGKTLLYKGREEMSMSRENLMKIMDQFPAHEYVGEVRWQIVVDKNKLGGKLTYPILKPHTVPGTLEFEFAWSSPAKKVVFASLMEVLKFLQPLASSVLADNLLVEPKKLPPDIHDERYQRFKMSSEPGKLTSVDWIVGYRKQARDSLAAIEDFALKKVERNGFKICALSDGPFDYAKETDRERLKLVERKIGI